MTSEELNIIRESIYNNLHGILNSNDYGIFCDLHDPKIYDADDDKSHNCIGCNLNEYSQILVNSLRTEQNFLSEYELFSRFIINAYILTERIRVYTKILKISDEDYNKTYPTMRCIMKWANFIKHPKAFMLVHSPEYSFDGTDEYLEKIANKNYTKIEQAFIDKFYSGPTNNNELYTTLTNQRDVLVVFPDPILLSNSFTIECLSFIQSILTTEDYRKTLKDGTTLENYFSEPDED